MSLTGNVKLCCYIDDSKVERATLNPLSSISTIIPHSINLKTDNYAYNLSQFYKDYMDTFYDPQVNRKYITESVFTDIQGDDKYFSGNIGDCQSGLKRVSLKKNGKQYSIFAPLFINSEKELPSIVQIVVKNKNNRVLVKRNIDISEDTVLGDYLKRSYKEINGDSTDPRIMYISPGESKEGVSAGRVRGFDVERGCLVTVNSSIVQKIYRQDLTHTEFDYILCQEFKNNHIVVPHIINFCWYFNIEDIVPSGLQDYEYGDFIYAYIQYINNEGTDENPKYTYIDDADLDFNHYNISDGNEGNVLDYLHERDLTKIINMQTLHLVPTISKWTLSNGDRDYIYNTYLGYEGTKLGYQIDTHSTKAIKDTNNLAWISVAKTFNVSSGSNFNINNILSGYNGYAGFSFIYDSTDDIKKYSINTGNKLQCMCNKIMYNINSTYKDYTSMFITCISDINTTSTDNPTIILVKDEKDKSLGLLIYVPMDIIGTNKEKSIYDYNPSIALTLKNIILEDKIGIKYEFTKNSSGNWSYTVHEGTEEDPTIVITSVLTLIEPKYTYVNKQLFCKYNEEGEYTLYQNQKESNNIISRYCGWIQPRLITVSDGIPTENDFVLLKRKTNTTTDNDYGYLKFVDIGTIGFNSWIFDDNIPEGKWFDISRSFYLPETLSGTFSDSTKSVEDCLNDILEDIYNRVDENYRSYIKNLYRYKIDISKDRTTYTIILELK